MVKIVDFETLSQIDKDRLTPRWCTCRKSQDVEIWCEDGQCNCGISKHHAHFLSCGHISQVG